MISILILTKNEEDNLPACLASVSWCDDIHVFDSFSTDKTKEIALDSGAKVTQRVFDDWSSHQNWGLANIPFKYQWILYIDADERVSTSLLSSLRNKELNKENNVAYNIRRRDFAWDGTWLKHAQISPYYLRLFKRDKMRYERLVNPISLPDGPISSIGGYLDHYPFSKGIKFWFQRHLSYADLEATMRLKDITMRTSFSYKKALFSSNPNEKRFHQKGLFYKMPCRPLIKWFYMVFFRCAFLDGSAGITYSTFQAIYEYFIVLKTKELLHKKEPTY